MNIRDEIGAMDLTEKQAVVHLADEIDSLRKDMMAQHSTLKEDVQCLRKEFREFRTETKMSLKRSADMNLRLVFMIAGVMLTLAINIVMLAISL